MGKYYHNTNYNDFVSSTKKIIFIDNFEKIKLNNTHRNTFFEKLLPLFNFIILTCSDSNSFVKNDTVHLVNAKEYHLVGLGNLKREEIVKKWLSIGVSEIINEHDLYTECDELKDRLNAIIKKNIVPPKPIYVLMLMQMFEAYSSQKLELTSYGHCYQALIYKSLDNARIQPNQIEKHINTLTELAWEILINNSSPINLYQKNTFIKSYEEKFITNNDTRQTIETLKNHHILKIDNDALSFKYPYIYYFFVGKKIAENYTSSQIIEEKTAHLLKNLHREDFANILIFITHHTKDSWILESIKEQLNNLFSDHDTADLRKEDLSFMSSFIQKIPKLVIEQRNINKERDNRNTQLDKSDQNQTDEEDYEKNLEIVSNVNKTFKGVEICGQIIRNRHATILKDELTTLAENGIDTGLRFLSYFLAISDIAKGELIKIIKIQLLEQPELSNKQLESVAEDLYHSLTYGVIHGVIKKISESIGSKEASSIYTTLETKKNTPAMMLIKTCIDMRFQRKLDVESLEKAYHALKSNPVCSRILRESVIQHIYMYPIDTATKQKIASKLSISLQQQQQLSQKLVINYKKE